MGYRYNWQENSAIRQMKVAKNPSARVEATIYAPEIISDKMAALPQYLTNNGFICYLDEVDGKHVLKVTGFGKKEVHLVDTLRSGGFVSGEADRTRIPDDNVEPGAIARIRKNAMHASGAFGDIGHLAMAVSGKLEGDNNRIATAALYGASATISALFGTGVGAIRFSEMINNMRDYLAEKGMKLTDPLIVTPERKFRERTWREQTLDFVRTHPIQVSQAISLTGNISLFQSGFKEMRTSGGKQGVGRLFAGIVTAASALIAMFMHELTPQEIEAHKKEKGFWRTLREGHVANAMRIIPHRFHMLIARSPLAFQGLLLLSDNVGMLFDAYQTNQKYKVWKEGGTAPSTLTGTIKGVFTGRKPPEVHQDSHYQRIAAIDEKLYTLEMFDQHVLYNMRKPEEALKASRTLEDIIKQRKELHQQITGLERMPHGSVFSWITAVAYTAASTFNTISSKRRASSFERTDVYNELYTYAANVVLDLPKDNQDEVVKKMAFYLSANRNVHVQEEEVEKGITSKLTVLKKNPWMASAVAVETTAANESAAPVDTKKQAKPWMEKVAEADIANAAIPSRA